jgi:hypothetical protein
MRFLKLVNTIAFSLVSSVSSRNVLIDFFHLVVESLSCRTCIRTRTSRRDISFGVARISCVVLRPHISSCFCRMESRSVADTKTIFGRTAMFLSFLKRFTPSVLYSSRKVSPCWVVRWASSLTIRRRTPAFASWQKK